MTIYLSAVIVVAADWLESREAERGLAVQTNRCVSGNSNVVENGNTKFPLGQNAHMEMGAT